ncbi:MAG: hypothetical protein AAF411_01635 [Myxococcota bacterium]
MALDSAEEMDDEIPPRLRWRALVLEHSVRVGTQYELAKGWAELPYDEDATVSVGSPWELWLWLLAGVVWPSIQAIHPTTAGWLAGFALFAAGALRSVWLMLAPERQRRRNRSQLAMMPPTAEMVLGVDGLRIGARWIPLRSIVALEAQFAELRLHVNTPEPPLVLRFATDDAARHFAEAVRVRKAAHARLLLRAGLGRGSYRVRVDEVDPALEHALSDGQHWGSVDAELRERIAPALAFAELEVPAAREET